MNKEETWKRIRKLTLHIFPPGMPKGQWNLVGLGQTENLIGVDLSGADLSGADLRDALFTGTILREANFRGADLIEAGFSEGDLYKATFSGADLHKADFSEANLSHADLDEADLSRGNFYRADLREARLRGADLSGTNFHRANLREVNLTESVITDANFNLADLSGADITGSTFWGVSTAGWRIEGIKARHVYFCRASEKEKQRYRRDFKEGQFEALYKSLPKVELIFEEGLNPTCLFTLTALIEEIGRQNPQLSVRTADISKNEFETRVGITLDKDENLNEVGRLIQDGIKTISSDLLAPYLAKMLPADWQGALSGSPQTQRPSFNVNINMVQPTIQLVATDGTVSGSISQYGMIQGSGNVIINYGAHEGELDELFDKLKECLANSEASMKDKLILATDRLAEALRKGKDVDTIQGYWEQIKEGLKTAGPATTIVATIARLLGFM